MTKAGILHDYDLRANREPSSWEQKCVTCGAEPARFQWSDYSGEAMCTRCGTPYQLKWGTEEQGKEGAYPYLNLKDEWVPVVRRYYEETGRFTYLGTGLGERPGSDAFSEWVRKNNAAPATEDEE